MDTISESRCFGGVQGVYSHESEACSCDMTFGLFLPEEAKSGPVPLLWFLSGLTCTHENAMVKAGAQAVCADLGIGIVFPDTSPRGEGIADDEAYDLGQGAGFYVNATEAPWAQNFHMESYILKELSGLLKSNFAIEEELQAITGHSMGGHGALTLAMKNPGRFKSISAFAPISNPTQSDWGRKQFGAYLGGIEDTWQGHDATNLMLESGFKGPILTDTGTDDQFYQLLGTDAFAAACAKSKQRATIRLQQGYDHSYFFVSSFIPDHVRFHAEALFETD